MVNIHEVYDTGSTLKASDLNGQRATLTISGAEVRKYDDKDKIVLSFADMEKGMTLNVTNSNVIGEMYGPDTDGWIGKQITIYPTKVQFGTDIVDAIRVEYVSPQQMQQFQPSQRQQGYQGNPNLPAADPQAPLPDNHPNAPGNK